MDRPDQGSEVRTRLAGGGSRIRTLGPALGIHSGWDRRPCQDSRMARERGREYAAGMMELSYRRHRFPPVVIQHAVWLYLRFTLTYRDLADLLADRHLDISSDTV